MFTGSLTTVISYILNHTSYINKKKHTLSYLEKHAFLDQLISIPPQSDLGIIVVIPAYNEPDLIASLKSLHRCGKPNCSVEVIIVINDGENSPDNVKLQNATCYEAAQKWSHLRSGIQIKYHPLYIQNLPKKHAGVGLARKIGMDEAVRRFESLNRNGVITSFDADSTCSPNYFQEIHAHFDQHEKCDACSIHYEHPINGSGDNNTYAAIVLYELHLRYYINALKFAGFQQAVQTVGSAIAVKSKAYQQQGGMSKRKAGEDFYFIHKFTPLGTFKELKTTTIFPSPRVSNRVPFGTGKAVGEILENERIYDTYNPESFKILKQFVHLVPDFYSSIYSTIKKQIAPQLIPFLEEQGFENILQEIKTNSTDQPSFKKRFYRWFNAFRVMKLLHFLRDTHFPNVGVREASMWLIGELQEQEVSEKAAVVDMLLWFRKIDKKV